jgi:hypothetical protein
LIRAHHMTIKTKKLPTFLSQQSATWIISTRELSQSDDATHDEKNKELIMIVYYNF